MEEMNQSPIKANKNNTVVVLLLVVLCIAFALLYLTKPSQNSNPSDKDTGVRVLQAPSEQGSAPIVSQGRVTLKVKNGDTFSFIPPLNWEYVGNETQPAYKTRECLIVVQPEALTDGKTKLDNQYSRTGTIGELALNIQKNVIIDNPARNYYLGSADVFSFALESPESDSMCLEDYFLSLSSTRLESRSTPVLNVAQ